MSMTLPPAVAAPPPRFSAQPVVESPADKAAREFEAVFLGQVFTQMLETVEVGELGGGHAEEQWRSMLAGAMADDISKQGGLGIAKDVADDIRAMIEAERSGSV